MRVHSRNLVGLRLRPRSPPTPHPPLPGWVAQTAPRRPSSAPHGAAFRRTANSPRRRHGRASSSSQTGMSEWLRSRLAPRSVRKLRSPSGSMMVTEDARGLGRIGNQHRIDMEAAQMRLEMRLVLGADPRHEADRRAHGAQPYGLVGARATRPLRDRGAPVRAAHQRSFGDDDDVGHHVADDDDPAGCAHLSSLLSATAISAATRALFSTSAILADEALALGELEDALQAGTASGPCGRPLRVGILDRFLDTRRDHLGRQRAGSRGSGGAHEHAAQPERELQRNQLGRVLAGLDSGGRPCRPIGASRSPGNRRCRNRAPARPCSPALRGSWEYRGWTWPRRTPPPPGCGRARRDRPKYRRWSRRRDARRQCRRSRTPGCPPLRPPSSWWQRSCRQPRSDASSAATSRREASAALPPTCASRSRSSPGTPTLNLRVHDGDRRRHRACCRRSPSRRSAPSSRFCG